MKKIYSISQSFFVITLGVLPYPIIVGVAEVFRLAIGAISDYNYYSFMQLATIGLLLAAGELIVGYCFVRAYVSYKERIFVNVQSEGLLRSFQLDEETMTRFELRDALQRAVYDSSSLQLGKFDIMLTFFKFITSLIIVLGYALYTSIGLTILVFLLTGITLIVETLYSPIFQRLSKDVLDSRTNLKSFIHRIFIGYESLITDPEKSLIHNRFAQLNQRYKSATSKRLNKQSEYIFSTNLTRYIVFIIFMSSSFFLVSNHYLEMEEVVSFLIIYGRIMEPAQLLGKIVQNQRGLITYQERLNDFFVSSRKQPRMKVYNDQLSIENISFRYQGNPNIGFDPFTLQIERGRPYFLEGDNGCGKSTLLKSVAGFMDLQSTQSSEHQLKVIYLARVPEFFNGTVLENMIMGRSCTHKFEQLKELFDLQFIEQLPQKWNTMLDREGGILSLGQKQRLALFRTIIDLPDLLILDEATSALDPEMEASVMEPLMEMMEDRFIIIVSHRQPSYPHSMNMNKWGEVFT